MSDISSEFSFAVAKGDLSEATRMIDSHGLSEGYQLLRIAVEKNNTTLAKLILSRDCPVTKHELSFNDTPLHCAVRNSNVEIVELLLRHGVNVNQINEVAKNPLAIAVEGGCLPIVDILLRYGAFVNCVEEDYFTPLHIACRRNFTEIVNLLLEKGALINARTKRQNQTPLHIAVESGNSDVVNLLLTHGAEVDCEDRIGTTPLYIGVARGELPMVEAILKFKPAINKEINRKCIKTAFCGRGKDFDKILQALLDYGLTVGPENAKDTAFFLYAVEKGNFKIVSDLLKHGADSHGLRLLLPLHRAVKFKHEQIAELLLRSKAVIDAIDCKGHPPIFYSVENADLKMTQLFLHNGSNIKLFPELLHLAVRKNSIEIIELLLFYGADINAGDNSGRTPLHVTALNEVKEDFVQESAARLNPISPEESVKLKIAQFLIDNGANVDAQTETGATALHVSIMNRFNSMFDLLVRNRANVELVDEKLETLLHTSAAFGNRTICSFLLDQGAEINAKRKDKKTPLHLAVSECHVGVVKMLLDRDAHVNCADERRQTPLHLVAGKTTILPNAKRYMNIITMLLGKGAEVNAEDNEGNTALHLAVTKGHEKLVEFLLDSGAELNRTEHGHTPLHLVAMKGSPLVCRLEMMTDVHITSMLLGKGAEIDDKDNDGNTALHLAASHSHAEVVECLVENGAQVNSKGQFDRTPLHFAAEEGNPEIINFLLTSGANVNSVDNEGATPLHVSSKKGNTSAVDTLLEYGADVNMTMNIFTFYTPLDCAWIDYQDKRRRGVQTYATYYGRGLITETVDFLIKHQIKLKAVGLYVREPVLQVDRGEEEFKDFHLSCQREIMRMKSEMISGTNVSYHEILRKNTRLVAKYMHNENMVKASELEEYKDKFPLYAGWIKSQFTRGLSRMKLLERVSHVLNRLSKLPENCIEEILDYLTDDDLKILI